MEKNKEVLNMEESTWVELEANTYRVSRQKEYTFDDL